MGLEKKQEAENLLDRLQNTRQDLKRLMKCDNQHPFLDEINCKIHLVRDVLLNWDEGRWEDIRWGRYDYSLRIGNCFDDFQ